jgi:hypothetical protein
VDSCPLPETLTAQWYRDFLGTVLPGLLEVVPQRLWFQHDGAPANYGSGWKGHIQEGGMDVEGGPIAWPPRSRGLVFFSWGGVRLRPLGTSVNIWLIVQAPDDR